MVNDGIEKYAGLDTIQDSLGGTQRYAPQYEKILND